MDEGFHVLLPSNVKEEGTFHRNTIGHYTTILPYPLQLDGDWLVGLKSISYTHSWYNIVDGDFFYLAEVYPDKEGKAYHGKTISKVIPLMAGHYESALDIMKEVETRMLMLEGRHLKIAPQLEMEAASNRIIIKYGRSDSNEFVTIVFSDEVRDMLGMNDIVFLVQEGLYSSDTYSSSPLIDPKSSSKRSVTTDGENEEIFKRGKREYDAVSEALDYLPALARSVENHPKLNDFKQCIVYVNTLLNEYQNSTSTRLPAIQRLFSEQHLHGMKRLYLNTVREIEADLQSQRSAFSQSAVDANNAGGQSAPPPSSQPDLGVLIDVVRVPEEKKIDPIPPPPPPPRADPVTPSQVAPEGTVSPSQQTSSTSQTNVQKTSDSPANAQQIPSSSSSSSSSSSAGNDVWDQQERRWKPQSSAGSSVGEPSTLSSTVPSGSAIDSQSRPSSSSSGQSSLGEAAHVPPPASQTFQFRQIESKPEFRQSGAVIHPANEAKESMRRAIKYNSRGLGATAMRGPSFFDYPNGGIMGKHPVDITRGIHHIMIYSDVGDFVTVGNTRTQLLQNIEIPSSVRGGDQLVKRFDHPDYIPVIAPFIPQIEIDLKDDSGRPIAFEFGRVYIKLHFRKRQEQDI